MLGSGNEATVGIIFDNGDGKVIAAGPMHHINERMIHPTLIRAVLIRDYGKYRVGLQRWDYDGKTFHHAGFVETKDYDEGIYKEATKAFANVSLELAVTHPELWD